MNKITMPSDWHEVTVSMFQELAQLETTDGMTRVIDMISILSNTDPDEVAKINGSDLEPILDAITWSSKTPTDKFVTEFTIDGIEYYVQKLSSLSIAENVDLDAYSKDISKLHKFFALLYRPANEAYSVELTEARAELFLDKLMIADVYGTILFFLNIAKSYELIIQACTQMNQKQE
jgi:hypothetical protein